MKYNEIDRDKLLTYYNKLIGQHLDNYAQAQGWASYETENARFEIFMKIGELNNSSILDVGCGFGDLFDFLKKKKLIFSYTGIDVNPEMIKVAKNRHQGIDFRTVDFGAFNPEKKFDFVFCSGALSLKIDDYKKLYFSHVKKMFELSKIGASFNMLTIKNNYGPEDDELYATYEIPEVQDFCSQLTQKATILQDYLPNDFTFFLYH